MIELVPMDVAGRLGRLRDAMSTAGVESLLVKIGRAHV